MLCVRKLRFPIRTIHRYSTLLDRFVRTPIHGRNHSSESVGSSFSSTVNLHRNHNDVIPSDHLRIFSSSTVLIQARDPAKLSLEIEAAIDEHRLADSWTLYEKLLQMDGFPPKSIVNKLVTSFAASLDSELLDKAFKTVDLAFEKGKDNLFDKECLLYLALSLAKCGSAVSASTILRKMISIEMYPQVSCWSNIVGHMSETAPGAILAAELIREIVFLFRDGRVDPRKKSNAPMIAMKPNTTAFNVVLVGCLLSGASGKAEQLLETMATIGVRSDTTSLIVTAHIYERNGRREDLTKLWRKIDEAPDLTDRQLCQFHNCILSCYLKLRDVNSACDMVLLMLRRSKEAKKAIFSATFQNLGPKLAPQTRDVVRIEDSYGNSIVPYEEFYRDRKFRKMEAESQIVLDSLLSRLHLEEELVTMERGILRPTEKVYRRLVKYFLEDGNTKDLTSFLVKSEREDCPSSSDDSALVNVIRVCISLGWLDRAHDILDEMFLSGVKAGPTIYSTLLKAYCEENRTKEAVALARDARRAGVQLEGPAYQALIRSKVLNNDTQGALDVFKEMKEEKIPTKLDESVIGCGESGAMSKLLAEIKEGQRVDDSGVHDWNNVVHFFCKKRLMGDAESALKKMRSLGLVPNAQTFHSLVTAYAAIGQKYIEVTELWGEMKLSAIKFDQEILDSVLYTFVRGGFFARANEVVEVLEKRKMFVDKYKYRTLFLKYHKTLYKGKAPKFQTEAQAKKREAALAFKKWVGLN